MSTRLPWPICAGLILLFLGLGCIAPAFEGEPVTRLSAAATRRPQVDIWRPSPGTSWQWQLMGSIDTSFDVAMYDIDLFDAPQATINQLHTSGRIVICYFSAGSWEDWRSDAAAFPEAVKGKALDGWPNEKWLDVRQIASLTPLMTARLDLAVTKKCDGVEPDNVDGYANDSGFPLTAGDQIAYNRWLVQQAHQRGLSIGLKNDLDQIPDLVGDFDWALNEQCFEFDECATLLPFVQAGKAVFGVEYTGNAAIFCPKANQMGFSWLKKNLNLDPERLDCLAQYAPSTPTATPTPQARLQILLPLYSYPVHWDPPNYLWDDVAAGGAIAPIVAIVNPNNGPGGGPPNADYTIGLNALTGAGVPMLGYIYTLYGARPLAQVKADVDLYAQHFPVAGIFVDETASSGDKVAYYGELYDYIRAQPALKTVVLNPGTSISEQYISRPAGDVAVIFEDVGSAWPGHGVDGYVAGYPAQRFAMLAHTTANSAAMRQAVDLALARNVGYVYVTNDGLDNPWDSLPTYWSELLVYVAGANQQATATSTPTHTSTPTRTATPTQTATPTPTHTSARSLFLPEIKRP